MVEGSSSPSRDMSDVRPCQFHHDTTVYNTNACPVCLIYLTTIYHALYVPTSGQDLSPTVTEAALEDTISHISDDRTLPTTHNHYLLGTRGKVECIYRSIKRAIYYFFYYAPLYGVCSFGVACVRTRLCFWM